jgi:hypothetical protein
MRRRFSAVETLRFHSLTLTIDRTKPSRVT